MLTFTTSLHTNKPYILVFDKVVECSNSVTSTANACHDNLRKLSSCNLHLTSDFLADDFLEVTDDGGERMRPDCRPNEIVRVREVCYPIPKGLIDRVLQSTRSRVHGDDLERSIFEVYNLKLRWVYIPYLPTSRYGRRSRPVVGHPLNPCRLYIPFRISHTRWLLQHHADQHRSRQ